MRKAGVLLCVILSIQFYSCGTNNVNKEVPPKGIKVEVVKSYGEDIATNFIGKVVANREISFAFRVAGILENISVEVGQMVRKGEVVAELDRRDYKTQLLATEAEYSQVKAEAERIIELYNRKSLPKNDYDKAVSGLKQITAKLTAHRDALADCTLRAPINGSIQRVIYSRGEMVGAGTPVISMVSSDRFEVEVFVPSSFYSKMEGSQFCQIPIVSDKNYTLEFVSIAPKANASGLYAVRYRILGVEGDKLAAGMSSSVAINNSLNDDELVTVALSAVFERDGESYIWVYDDNKNRVAARKVNIVKLLNGGDVVIKEGVESGEEVVVAGVNSINDSMVVEKLPVNSATNVGGLK